MTRQERAFAAGLEAGMAYGRWLGTLTPDERLHAFAYEHRRIVAALRDSPVVQQRLRKRLAERLSQGEGER